MYVVDGLYSHPKIRRAAVMAGAPCGLARVFMLYVSGLGYAHQHLTDGFVPQTFVDELPIANVRRVAEALSRGGLWHPSEGGWTVHDYLKHNDPAATVKAKREANRKRQAAWRARQ